MVLAARSSPKLSYRNGTMPVTPAIRPANTSICFFVIRSTSHPEARETTRENRPGAVISIWIRLMFTSG